MTTKTSQLAALINLALQKNTLLPVTAQELLAAIKETENELENISMFTIDARSVNQNLQQVLKLLSALLFALQNRSLGCIKHNKYLLLRTEMLYRKITQTLKWYGYVTGDCDQKFLTVKKLVAQLSVINKSLQQNDAIQELYVIWQPEINGLLATKKLPCHRWLWWSKCCVELTNTQLSGTACLENMLFKLNYNTPSFIVWLTQKLEREMEEQYTVPQKLAYLLAQLMQYDRLECNAEGYIPAERSVKQTLLSILHKKYKLFQHTPSLITQHSTGQAAKLHTALSVPQLALFIRLLVDTKVIGETSNLALLRYVAATISTEKAATLSPDSLKINYYTPGNAAKNIVKDYLLNMVNLLRTY